MPRKVKKAVKILTKASSLKRKAKMKALKTSIQARSTAKKAYGATKSTAKKAYGAGKAGVRKTGKHVKKHSKKYALAGGITAGYGTVRATRGRKKRKK